MVGYELLIRLFTPAVILAVLALGMSWWALRIEDEDE